MINFVLLIVLTLLYLMIIDVIFYGLVELLMLIVLISYEIFINLIVNLHDNISLDFIFIFYLMNKNLHNINYNINHLYYTYLYIEYLHLILKLMLNNVINSLLFHYYNLIVFIINSLVNLKYFDFIL